MAKKKAKKSKAVASDESVPTDIVATTEAVESEPKTEPESTDESNQTDSTEIADDEPSEVKEQETQKARRKKKGDDSDPFLAFLTAAKTRWPGAIERASALSTDGTPTMSTGNFGLDIATFGGLRRGRLYRFWGKPKSAKTGSALNCMEAFTSNHCAHCFDHRLLCKCSGEFEYAKGLFIDVEGRVSDNRPWAEAHGIDTDRLLFVSPKGGEQVVDIADAALRSDSGIGLIIVDSLAQMSSLSEVNKAAEKGQTIGRNAMLINSALRKWICSIVSKDIGSRQKPTIIVVNQIRNKTDGMGNPDTMPGGLGQEFASACDIKFSRRQYHYLISDGKGGYEDKVVKVGDGGFRPKEDDTADFVEVEYKITESGICPRGRFGSFNYWLRAAHGRRVGDVDNFTKLWDYSRTYGLLEKEKSGYKLAGLEAKTQRELEKLLEEAPDAQDQLWAQLVDMLKKK